MNRTELNSKAEFGFLCMRDKNEPYNVLMKKMRSSPHAKMGFQIVEAIPCTDKNCGFPPYPYSVTHRDREACRTLATAHKEFEPMVAKFDMHAKLKNLDGTIADIPVPKELKK